MDSEQLVLTIGLVIFVLMIIAFIIVFIKVSKEDRPYKLEEHVYLRREEEQKKKEEAEEPAS